VEILCTTGMLGKMQSGLGFLQVPPWAQFYMDAIRWRRQWRHHGGIIGLEGTCADMINSTRTAA